MYHADRKKNDANYFHSRPFSSNQGLATQFFSLCFLEEKIQHQTNNIWRTKKRLHT
jgi:hypothetical protein